MPLKIPDRSNDGTQSFNMTPIIDIVFLLIIFFLVVCQFIEAENFPVTVPDDCEFAQSNDDSGTQMTTITVMKTDQEGIAFAVGPEKVPASAYPDLVGIADKLAQLIDVRLRDLPPEHRIVTLRIDKDICFAQAQYALAAIAASSATDIQLATLKEKRTGLQ